MGLFSLSRMPGCCPDAVPDARMHGYDNANRVSSYSEPSKSQSYGYDAFGNMWQSGTASGVPELRPNGPSWYLVNNQVTNRLNSTVYDAGGYEAQLTVANGGTNAFFDAEGRLVQVVLGAVAATYLYDAEDRRVKRTDSGGNATYYIYNAEGQVMAEYAATPSASGTQYVSTDFLGSMRMLQDSLGNCIMRLDYAPYGAIVPRSGQDCYTAATWNGPLFAGGSHDSATDLDHMGARESTPHWVVSSVRTLRTWALILPHQEVGTCTAMSEIIRCY